MTSLLLTSNAHHALEGRAPQRWRRHHGAEENASGAEYCPGALEKNRSRRLSLPELEPIFPTVVARVLQGSVTLNELHAVRTSSTKSAYLDCPNTYGLACGADEPIETLL